jgi:hypothetical protein
MWSIHVRLAAVICISACHRPVSTSAHDEDVTPVDAQIVAVSASDAGSDDAEASDDASVIESDATVDGALDATADAHPRATPTSERGFGSPRPSYEHHVILTIRQGTVTVSGRLPEEVVDRIVRQNFGRFRACHEASKVSPTPVGRIVVVFVIDPKGKVSVKSHDSELSDPAIGECIAKDFAKLTFPEPEGGSVNVTFPIIFFEER